MNVKLIHTCDLCGKRAYWQIQAEGSERITYLCTPDYKKAIKELQK